MRRHPDSALADLESAIRATGARVTAPRVRVLGLLRNAPSPLSHGEIEFALGQEAFPAIDRVTLYRVLDWLIETGLAHKAADARGVFRFSAADPAGRHEQHLHFRCTGCGGVFCLDLPPPPPPSLPAGFHLSGMDLDIRGECAACAHP